MQQHQGQMMALRQFLISSLALLAIIQSVHSQSPKSVKLFDKLAAAVRKSDSQSLVVSLANLMAIPEMQRNPTKLRSEIVSLLKNKKVQNAADGRRTVKVIKLPPGIVKILNAKIPVRTKKQILDNVLSRLSKKKKMVDLKRSEEVTMREVSVSPGVVEEIPLGRDEKSVKFPESPLPSYGPVVPPQTGYLATDIAPSDSGYSGDLPSYGGAGDSESNEEQSQPGQTKTNNNQISNSRPGSQTSSGTSSGSNSPVGSASSSPDGSGEPSEENNFGFPARFGRAGIDFPIFNNKNIPDTSFSCESKVDGGYYADPETGCQLYHVCHQGNKFSQLCPNGTIYDQGQFACSNWRKVDCSAEGLQISEALVSDFAVEREFVTLNLDVSNPLEDLPWRNRNR